MTNATATATAPMTAEAAHEATDRIRTAATTFAKARLALARAIRHAREGEAHTALGMSWPEYVEHTLEGVGRRFGREDKAVLAAMMGEEGLSTRVIARIIGVSQPTASRMLKAELGEAERTVTGKDGREQRSGKGKGKGKGSSKGEGKASSKGEGKASSKGEGKAERMTLEQADTDDLLRLALDVTAELSRRWEDGDEAAERAVADLHAVVASHLE